VPCYQVTKTTFIGKIKKEIWTLLAVIQLTNKHFKHRHAADLKVSRLHKNIRSYYNTYLTNYPIPDFQIVGTAQRDVSRKNKTGAGSWGLRATLHYPKAWNRLLTNECVRINEVNFYKNLVFRPEKVAVVRCCGLIAG